METDLLQQSELGGLKSGPPAAFNCEDNAVYLFLNRPNRKFKLRYRAMPFVSYQFLLFAIVAAFVFLTGSFNIPVIIGIIVVLSVLKKFIRRKVQGDDFKRILGIPQEVIGELYLAPTSGRDIVLGLAETRADRATSFWRIFLLVSLYGVFGIAMTTYNRHFSIHTVVQLLIAGLLFVLWCCNAKAIALQTICNQLQQRLAFSPAGKHLDAAKMQSNLLAFVFSCATFFVLLVLFIEYRLLDIFNSLNVGLTLALLSALSGIATHLVLLYRSEDRNLEIAAECAECLIHEFASKDD